MWAEVTGGRLYIVHMSTGEGADIVKAARARGVDVYAETCVQYLVLDDSVFAKPDGHLYACCPQVKKPKDIERLWKGVGDGEVCVISTDTCTFTKAQKARWEGDWTRIPMGLPGLETLVPLVYTQGVLGKRMPLTRLVEKCCTNPAKIMGLYPRKGVLAAGSDADIAVLDPEKRFTVDHAQMETGADWNPYQGMSLAGIRAAHLLPRQADRRRLQVHRRKGLGPVAAAREGRRNQVINHRVTEDTEKKENHFFCLLCVLGDSVVNHFLGVESCPGRVSDTVSRCCNSGSPMCRRR